MTKVNQSGRTLLEVLMVMSVLGAFTASIFSLIANVTDKYRSNVILSQVREIRKAINHRYAAFGVYTGLTAELLAKERLVSANMIHNNKIYHTFKKEVALAVGDTGGAGRSFKITFPGLRFQNCVDLALIDWAVDSTAVLVNIKVNDKVFNWMLSKVGPDGKLQTTSSTSLPMTLPKAASACQDSNENIITWEFQ